MSVFVCWQFLVPTVLSRLLIEKRCKAIPTLRPDKIILIGEKFLICRKNEIFSPIRMKERFVDFCYKEGNRLLLQGRESTSVRRKGIDFCYKRGNRLLLEGRESTSVTREGIDFCKEGNLLTQGRRSTKEE